MFDLFLNIRLECFKKNINNFFYNKLVSNNVFLKGQFPASFLIYFRLLKQKIQFPLQIQVKKSIKYTVLEFEPTTFRTRVSSHNQ